jgi:tetratricopeptide (TPR) repeat protein
VTSIEISAFGRLSVTVDGEARRLPPMTAAVLARLLLTESESVTVVELARVMHPDMSGPVRREHRVAVQQRISQLRRVLDGAGDLLRTDRGAVTAYRLLVPRERVDILRFQDLVEQARTSPDDAAGLAERALRLWRDRPLLDVEDLEFAAGAIQRLTRLRDEAGRLCHRPAAEPEAGARPDKTPRQLPPRVGHFTGRRAELDTLTELTARPGGAVVISVIAGMAGIGKTATALHWAHEMVDAFPDGQLYVNLRGFDLAGGPVTPEEALRGFLDAFEVPPDRVPVGMPAQAALYRSLLAGRRALVVLDNASDADQVRPLLPGGDGCVVLVTSRNQLPGLIAAGAHAITLDVLPPEEARDLLAGRLGRQRVAAEPEATNQVVAACAGLPLALAIIAARAATRPRLPLGVLADELRDRGGGLDALAAGDASTDARAVFSCSYRALSPPAARLFRLLGVHWVPAIGVPAAASLAGVERSRVRAALTELERANLLRQETPGRYTMHDLLHGYAAELARVVDGEEDRDAALRRAFDHYLHVAYLASQKISPHRDRITLPAPVPGVTTDEPVDTRRALAWFAAERPALVAGVDEAAAHGHDILAWRLAWTLVSFMNYQGHWHETISTQRSALAAVRRLGDVAGAALSHRQLGLALASLQRHEEAVGHIAEALRLYRELADERGQAQSHLSLALVLDWQGEPASALEHARQALDAFRSAGHLHGQASATNMVGWCEAMTGDCRSALTHCREALALHQRLGDVRFEAAAWDSLGYAHRRLGEHEESTTCYHRAVRLYGEAGDRFNEADSLTHLGDAERAAGELSAARHAWQRALGILEAVGHPQADGVREKLRQAPAAAAGGTAADDRAG